MTVSNPEIAPEELEAKLDRAKDWNRYSPGCWLIHTGQTSDIWYGRMADLIAKKDTQVLICEVNLDDRAGRLSPTAWSWIKNVRQKTRLIAS